MRSLKLFSWSDLRVLGWLLALLSPTPVFASEPDAPEAAPRAALVPEPHVAPALEPPAEKPSFRHPALGWLMRSEAIMLLAVTTVHFAVMPELDQMMAESLSPKELEFYGPIFRLDHVVSGIFLAAMGLTTLYAANGIADGKRWGWWVCLINSAVLLTIPAVLLAVVGTRYFGAIPFASAAAGITAVSASMWIPLLVFHREFD